MQTKSQDPKITTRMLPSILAPIEMISKAMGYEMKNREKTVIRLTPPSHDALRTAAIELARKIKKSLASGSNQSDIREIICNN